MTNFICSDDRKQTMPTDTPHVHCDGAQKNGKRNAVITGGLNAGALLPVLRPSVSVKSSCFLVLTGLNDHIIQKQNNLGDRISWKTRDGRALDV